MSVTCAGLLRGRFIAVSHCNDQFVLITANKNEYVNLMSFLKHPECKLQDQVGTTFHDIVKLHDRIQLKRSFKDYMLFSVCGDSGEVICFAVMKCLSKGSSGELGSRMETLRLLLTARGQGWQLEAVFVIECCGGRSVLVDVDDDNGEGNGDGDGHGGDSRDDGKGDGDGDCDCGDGKGDGNGDGNGDDDSGDGKGDGDTDVGTVCISSRIIHYNKGKVKGEGEIEWRPSTEYGSPSN